MVIILVTLSLWATLNLMTFVAFRIDKTAALGGGRRVPEATLLGVAFWGGSLGAALAQRLLRHKTRKEPFRTRLRLIKALHILLALVAITNVAVPGAPAMVLALF
jgi:uncharacterized membrane protein YsdA (DUF1294 family)